MTHVSRLLRKSSETAKRCAYPGCEKHATREIPGGLLGACPEHIDLALFISRIYEEAEFHVHAE
jgi:hypothetical protein